MSNNRSRRRKPIHGIAFEPEQIQDDIILPNPTTKSNDNASPVSGSIQMTDLFVTMCFFARLGFVQPPSCLRCAYRASGCGGSNKKGGKISSCHELVAWRRDANIPLHPDKLEGNVVFVTCETASSLVNGDEYPSIRWNSKKRIVSTSE